MSQRISPQRRLVACCISILALSGCSLLAANPPRSVEWTEGPGALQSARYCQSFDALAHTEAGWWFAGPGCLLEVPYDRDEPRLIDFEQAGRRFGRVDGLASTGAETVWAVGRRREAEQTLATMGLFSVGESFVGSPAQWGVADTVLASLATTSDGDVWAVGRTGAGRIAVARYLEGMWHAFDVTAFGRGELFDVSVTEDGCAWAIGRGADGDGLLVRFDGTSLRREAIEDSVERGAQIAGISCGDVWLGGKSAVRYSHGHREEVGFGPEARLNGMDACGDGSVLIVGERVEEPGSASPRRVGFAFRLRDGAAEPVNLGISRELGGWRLSDVGCNGREAWAVGEGLASQEALLFQLGEGGFQMRGWSVF